MSAPDTPDQPATTAADEVPVPEIATGKKSYRRKYRKIMVNFEHKMRENTSLFKDEQRILDISHRLAEQTDQLLQLLVDLNSCPQLPQRQRYDVRPKYVAKDTVAGQEQHYTEESGHIALKKARHQLQIGETTPADYADLKSKLLDNSDFVPKKSYAELTQTVSSLPAQRTENGDASWGDTTGFLTVKQEEQYLNSLDAYINGLAPHSRFHVNNTLGAKGREKSAERDREAQLRNPVSVYNWLRQHKPGVFLQDNEASDKPARPAGARSSKRNANRDSVVKQEEELYDEEGIAVDTGGARGKRKREDDTGYRPKGGNSRPTKRKKDDPSGGRRSKKPSMDLR